MDSSDLAGVVKALLALAAVVVVVLLVRRRFAGPSTRPTGGRPPKRPGPPPADGPQPAERWWSDFPHQEDPTRSKARPCLVIGYSGKGYWVLKCTTQAPREAQWRVPVAATGWTPPADKDGYVDLVPFHLPRRLLERRQGAIGAATYRRIHERVRWDRATDLTR